MWKLIKMQIPIQWAWDGAKDSNKFPNDVSVVGPWPISSINCYLFQFSLAVSPLLFYSQFITRHFNYQDILIVK